jgi:3-oxoacyl-[acyl-carrier protein] reductase
MADKIISIVTGASRGIGEAIAFRLAKENHCIMLIGRNEEQLKVVREKILKSRVECDYFAGDVANPEFVQDSVGQIISKYGKVDHLINNAGVAVIKRLIDSDLNEFKRQIDTNLYGIYNFSKAVLLGMIKNNSGSIINISSLAGKNSFVGGTMYSASKHAVLGFAKSLLLEVREYDIRVATICPGSVDTRFIGTDSDLNPSSKGNILHPSDVADMVVAILKLPPRALASEIDLRPTNPKK